MATGPQHKGQEPLWAPPSSCCCRGLGAALTFLSRGDRGVCRNLQAFWGANLDGSDSKDKAPPKSTPGTQPRRTKRANKINSLHSSRRQNIHKPKFMCSFPLLLGKKKKEIRLSPSPFTLKPSWIEFELKVESDSLRPHGLYRPWNSPGQNTRVGSLSLLQGIFPTQGSNPGLLHCRWILYQLSHRYQQ